YGSARPTTRSSTPTPRPRGRDMRARGDGERGQTTVLTVGYVVIAMLLVTVVVNLSRVFLAQRALDSAADEAAIAAVQAVRTRPYYGEGVGEELPLSASGTR